MRLETVLSVCGMSLVKTCFYNPDSEECVPYALDVSILRWYRMGGQSLCKRNYETNTAWLY